MIMNTSTSILYGTLVYNNVHLHQSGVGKREISLRLGFSRQIVSTYLTWTEVPYTIRSLRTTILDPYRQKVVDLVQQSLSGTAILRHIRAILGFYLAELRRTSANGPTSRSRQHRVSPREAAILLTMKEDQVNDKDEPYCYQLLHDAQGAENPKDVHVNVVNLWNVITGKDCTIGLKKLRRVVLANCSRSQRGFGEILRQLSRVS